MALVGKTQGKTIVVVWYISYTELLFNKAERQLNVYLSRQPYIIV